MSKTSYPHADSIAEAAELLALNDDDLEAAGVHLAGGNAESDEHDAMVAQEEKRTGRAEEAMSRELNKLRLELEQTQEFVRRLAEAGTPTGAMGAMEQARQRREVNDAMIDAIISRGGRCTVMVHPDPTPNMNWPVQFSINGQSIQIRRGVPVEIPVEYLGVMRDARKTERVPLLDAGENPVPGGVDVDMQSYPFSLMPGALPEESLGRGFRAEDMDLRRGANQPRVKLPVEAHDG
jgi:hypothetical protein